MIMSEHENARAYIASMLEKVGTLDKLAGEISSPRSGNGWDPSKIAEVVVRIVPQPLDKLARKAVRPGISRMIADLFRPTYATSRIIGPPTLVYFPLWHVKGYHECYYLRDGDYKIRVDKDVVAVEVDGETRDLMMEEENKIVPEAFRRGLKRFAGLFTAERKYFNLADPVELALRQEHAEMYVTFDGQEGEVLEEILPRSWTTERIFDVTHLNVPGAVTKIAASRETKERAVERFQERLVKMPKNPRHVLSNTFQIEELTLYYIPYVHFPVLRAGKVDHVIVNAASTRISDERMTSGVKRQLDL